MNRFACACFCHLLLGVACLPAQTPQPPPDPATAPITGNARWVIQVNGLAEKENKEAQPTGQPTPASTPPPAGNRTLRQIEVTRSNNLLRRVKIWADGTRTERWWLEKYLLIKEPQYDTIFIVPWRDLILSEEAYEEFSNVSFPELRWVNKDTFLDWTSLNGREVAVYGQTLSDAEKFEMREEAMLNRIVEERTGIKPEPSNPADSQPTTRVGYARLAWIDGATRRPIAMESQRLRRTYTFTDGEVPPIELPPGFHEAIGRYLEAANVQTLDIRP